MILLGLIIGIVLVNLISLINSEVRINEVELNPSGSDSGNEWVELYSNEEINLTGWRLVDASDDSMELDIIINGYYVLEDIDFNLRNTDEEIYLYNQDNLISEFSSFDDSDNDDKTWQYCNENWNFTYMTKDAENNCTISQPDPVPTPEEIYIELSWDDEDIENGKDFKINIDVFNLEDKSYDFKMWIEGEEGDEYEDIIITDRFGEDSDGDDKWKSGTYWIYHLFAGPGDKTKKVELRIREDYEDYYGGAILFFKLEDENEEDEYIDILRKDNSQISSSQSDSQSSTDSMRDAVIQNMENINSTSTNTISLGRKTEDLKEQNNILYQSKNELIKNYAIYGFALFCVILAGLLAFEKLK